jgi:hypothetical protein
MRSWLGFKIKKMKLQQYRKKPIIIHAVQFLPDIAPLDQRVTEFTGQMFDEFKIYVDEKGPFLSIPTLEGIHRANNGDWIITGIKGEKYPCKPDIFQMTYEAVEA